MVEARYAAVNAVGQRRRCVNPFMLSIGSSYNNRKSDVRVLH